MKNVNYQKLLNVKHLFSLLVLATVMFSINFSKAHAAPDSSLYFDPATDSVLVDDDFTLDAMIDPGTNSVGIVELDFTFDQTKLRLDGITEGADWEILTTIEIDNNNGTASVDLYIPFTDPYLTSISTMATLSFHALATATDSEVAYTTASQAAADGESGDVVISRTGAEITITTDGSDSTPPVISAGSPSGTLSAGTTSTTVSVTTDENATCRLASSSGVAFSSMDENLSGSGTSHTFTTAASLKDGSSYGYFVKCQDGSGNYNATDYLVSFSVASSSSSSSSSSHSSKKKKKKKKKKSVASRSLSVSKKNVRNGDVITERGKKFSKNSFVLLYFERYGGMYYPPIKIKTTSSGKFAIKYLVNKPIKGKYHWYAVDLKTGKKSKTSYFRVK